MTKAIGEYNSDHMEMAFVDTVYKALKAHRSTHITKISYDGDHKSCELIVTMQVDGVEKDLVLSSQAIKERP
jgi:hypothetical protein